MPWGRVDDTLYDHPKLDALGDDRLAGAGLWIIAISWSNRWLTDGALSSGRVERLGGTLELADKLVAVGLFDLADDGYLIHDFHDFNESKEKIQVRRRQAIEAGRLGGYARSKSLSESPSEPLNGSPSETLTNARAQGRGVPSRPDNDPPGNDQPAILETPWDRKLRRDLEQNERTRKALES